MSIFPPLPGTSGYEEWLTDEFNRTHGGMGELAKQELISRDAYDPPEEHLIDAWKIALMVSGRMESVSPLGKDVVIYKLGKRAFPSITNSALFALDQFPMPADLKYLDSKKGESYCVLKGLGAVSGWMDSWDYFVPDIYHYAGRPSHYAKWWDNREQRLHMISASRQTVLLDWFYPKEIVWRNDEHRI